ncbi:MAG: response regulator [Pseudobdellovibrio sp.]
MDDEAAIREVSAKTLSDFGYRILEATNGAEAVAVYLQHKNEIALVLTDVSMPVMDGAALIAALKSVNSKVRVVVTSGLPMNGELAKAMDLGVRHFLLKPFNAEKLLRTIYKELMD